MTEDKVSRRGYVKYAAAGIVVVGGAAAGLYYASTPTKPPTPTETSTTQTASEAELIAVYGGEATTIDPAVNWYPFGYFAIANCYESLFHYEKGGDPVPWVGLDSYEMSPDAKTWTFKLKDGIRFHNGDRLDSYAVKWSIDRAIYHAYGVAGILSAGLGPNYQIETPDDLTVKMILQKPVAWLPHVFAAPQGFPAIINPKEVEANGGDDMKNKPGETNPWLGDHEAGSGPYRLVEYEVNMKIKMERLDDYWDGKKPQIPKYFTINRLDEEITRNQMVLKGDADFNGSASPQGVETLEGNSDITIVNHPDNSFEGAVINCQDPILKKTEVRQALSYATPYDDIIRVQARGYGIRCTSIFSLEGGLGYSPEIMYEYDLAKAKELLTNAGYPNGFKTKIGYGKPGNPYDIDVLASLMKDSYGKIGVDAELFHVSDEIGWGMVYEGKIPIYLGGWLGAAPGSPIVLVPDIFHTRGIETGMNLAHFSNAEIDSKIEEIDKMTSMKDIDNGLRELNKMIYQEASWIFMYNFAESIPFSKKVHVPYLPPTEIFYFQPWILEVTKEM